MQMEGLQRSSSTFRRSGSSGLVWDERFLTEEAEAKAGEGGGTEGEPELVYYTRVVINSFCFGDRGFLSF